MKTYRVLTFVGFLLIVSTTHAIVLHHEALFDCTVQEVRYDACGKTISNEECDGNGLGFFKVSVDYTMDGCENTRCPVEAGKNATYIETVNVPKWADKEITKWTVLLSMGSLDDKGPTCIVVASSFDVL